MLIIGVEYHPSDQYIALVDTETGECGERRLNHSDRRDVWVGLKPTARLRASRGRRR